MRVTVLSSGSDGNATLFEACGTRVLVDAGIAPRTLDTKLRELGGTTHLDGIVVTHAHQDHVGNARRLGKRGIPVYMSEATARHVDLGNHVQVKTYSAREPFAVGRMVVSPTPLPHDAAQVALVVEGGGKRAAIATDLGEVPPSLVEHLAGVETLLIEANHDPAMVEAGPYPGFLKRRVLSARGHLSNAQTAELLRKIPRSVRTVILVHLSRTNNRETLAREIAADALPRGVALLVAPQRGRMSVSTRMQQLGLPL